MAVECSAVAMGKGLSGMEERMAAVVADRTAILAKRLESLAQDVATVCTPFPT